MIWLPARPFRTRITPRYIAIFRHLTEFSA
jgi:hypothetical protein